jgi:hypothetical protein
VVSDLLGISGCRIIEALIRGEDSPEILSGKVRERLRKKEKLNGRFGGAATIAAVWRRRKLINDSHSGGKALNPRGLGTESPTIKRSVFRTRTPRRMERLDGRWTGRF